MTPKRFIEIRQILNCTQAQIAVALRLEGGERTIRYYESGQRKIPGPVSVAMEYFLLDKSFKKRLTR